MARLSFTTPLLTLTLLCTILAQLASAGPNNHKHFSSHGAEGHRESPVVWGSCRAANLCCQGKNITCSVQLAGPSHRAGYRSEEEGEEMEGDNSVQGMQKKKEGVCFCDSACADIGDCCKDYKLACPTVDCILAEDWNDWGECDARCGPGIKTRSRDIVQTPMNGGKACPHREERIACEGTACKIARAPEGYEELKETATIISAEYGNWRNSVKYNPFKDIRRNLFERYMRKQTIDRPAYCMEFEVTELWPACVQAVAGLDSTAIDNSTAQLVKGNTICVECQPLAMKKSLGSRCKGQGVFMKETRWKAILTAGCRGKWILKTKPEDCQCNAGKDNGFILL